MDEPALSSAEVVDRLWREVRLRDEAVKAVGACEVGSRPAMLDDQALRRLLAPEDEEGVDPALLAVISGLARRADELGADVAALADALARTAERLAERDETLHRLLEDRVERLEGDGGPGPT